MRINACKIYIEQLRNGHVEKINEIVPPDFLDITERDLAFKDPVAIEGEAYIASDDLILRLAVETHALIPCSICNENVKVQIQISNLTHAEPLGQIKSGVFDFMELLREAILLETPAFAECNDGKCSKRKEIKKYLKDPAEKQEGYRPFADL